jgi:group I intron endonuclease
MFTNKLNGKQYVGSTINFYNRFHKNYYSKAYLLRTNNSFAFASALLKYNITNFWLTILEYLPIKDSNFYLRETYWISIMNSQYNINKFGGSNLGYKHSIEALKKMSESHKGSKNSQFGIRKFGDENPFFGKKHSEKTKLHLSKIKGTKINIYILDSKANLILLESFSSANKAAQFIGISRSTILKYAKTGQLFNNLYKFILP